MYSVQVQLPLHRLLKGKQRPRLSARSLGPRTCGSLLPQCLLGPLTRGVPQCVNMEEVDLSGDGGVLKKVLRMAKPGALAPSEDLPLVDLQYEGILAETNEVFDSTREDNTVFSFELGQGSVIKAWELAVKTMKVGEVARIICKPDYAYGKVGSPPEIPGDATLVFEVELLACKPRKGSTMNSVATEKAKLEELRKLREEAGAKKEEEKKKREEAKAAAAARIQAKLDAKKGGGKGKGKGSK